jgi:hypothetical protein
MVEPWVRPAGRGQGGFNTEDAEEEHRGHGEKRKDPHP